MHRDNTASTNEGDKNPKELRGGCRATVAFFFFPITTLFTSDSINNFLSPKYKSSVDALTKSFKHKGLQKYFETGNKSGINPEHALKLARILDRLDAAVQPLDMNLPSYKLHQLSGAEKETWSVWVSGNWRVTFRFEDKNVIMVNYLDCH